MTFLISINCTMLYGLWSFFVAVSSPDNATPLRRIAALVTFLGTALLSSAIFLAQTAPHLGSQQSTPALLLAGAIVTAVGCGLIVTTVQRGAPTTHFAASALAALLGCAYLAFTAVDHLRFFNDTERTGYLDATVAAEAGVQCARGFVLVKLDADRRVATYRCPMNIVFGDPLAHPFVPWPAYEENSSRELVRAIQRLEASTLSTP